MDMVNVEKRNKPLMFSKRRATLFRKASELCILSNAQIAIVVVSPAGKLFSFGHPNTKTVLTRYLKGTTTADSEPAKVLEMEKKTLEENRRFEDAMMVLEMEKKKLAEEIETMPKVLNKREWWNDPIEEMSVDQLEQFMLCVYELREKLAERANEL